MERIDTQIRGIITDILEDYKQDRPIDRQDRFNQPDKDIIIDVLEKLLKIVFPGHLKDRTYRVYSNDHQLSLLIEDVAFNLNRQIEIALKYDAEAGELTEEKLAELSQEKTLKFLRRLPEVRAFLDTDLQAALDGDPAATCYDEIIFAYPGLYAISVSRLAHELFLLGVPIVPRIMTEHAHSRTGIDIHPGATIGRYFFIDHGTGIVIGETTVIGEHVKVYQGVTLGALSTRGGQSLRGVKRHPNIEDNVTIYSGASILGGDTTIGRGAVIGGNAFITKSVGANTSVSVKNQELVFNRKDGKVETVDLEQSDDILYFGAYI